MARSNEVQGRSHAVLWGILAVFAFAVGTRLALATSKSLVLDEFHSYYHATRPSIGALLESLRSDNHPPLSFLIVGVSRSAFLTLAGGAEPGEWALRLPAIVFGLLEIAVVARIAGRLAGAKGALVAAALVAASSLHLDYGTQARMYTPHALAVTVALYALIRLLGRPDGHDGHDGHDDSRDRGAQVLLAVAAATSFHVHYFGIQYLTALVGCGALAAILSGNAARLLRLVAPGLVALVLCLPWGLYGFRHQLGHALPPGGDDLGPRALAESFVHLFFHNVSFGGPVFGWAYVVGAALILGCAARGALVLLARPEQRTAGVLLATSAFVVPVASWALANVAPRAGYTWHYVLPSTAAAAALAGVGATLGKGARPFRLGATLGLALAVSLVGLHLVHPATEDFRGAVRFALERANDAPAGSVTRVVSVEWQPALFKQGQPYDYYAPRLSENPPAREPMLLHEFSVVEPSRLVEADRVVVVRRSLPAEQTLLRILYERFGEPDRRPFGYGVDVLVFGR